jgi:hypothetical protein
MMQVENEVGILGGARDHSDPANRAFESAVPPELTHHLVASRESLYPELRDLWEQNGAKTRGTWEQIFGTSPRTDEIFMAWNYARYVHTVAASGKAAYDLPMYVNTWLAGEDATPGDYPSGGPQPRVLDIWKAAVRSYGRQRSHSRRDGYRQRVDRACHPQCQCETWTSIHQTELCRYSPRRQPDRRSKK